MPDISKECAEGLIDIAATIGVAQGIATIGGVDAETLDLITQAAEGLPDRLCPFTDEGKEALRTLLTKVRELAAKKDEEDFIEVSLDERVELQDNLNTLIKTILG